MGIGSTNPSPVSYELAVLPISYAIAIAAALMMIVKVEDMEEMDEPA
jgi:hypothetical protein